MGYRAKTKFELGQEREKKGEGACRHSFDPAVPPFLLFLPPDRPRLAPPRSSPYAPVACSQANYNVNSSINHVS